MRHLAGFWLLRVRKGCSGRDPPHACGPAMASLLNKAHQRPFPRKDCLRSLARPLYAFSPSTPSQHCTHSVTFPSETITPAPYTTQNAWCVNFALGPMVGTLASCTRFPRSAIGDDALPLRSNALQHDMHARYPFDEGTLLVYALIRLLIKCSKRCSVTSSVHSCPLLAIHMGRMRRRALGCMALAYGRWVAVSHISVGYLGWWQER